MATRFKANDLQEMIRRIVREEMGSVVKEAINEILSERYLKKLAESAAGHNRPRGVSNLAIQGDADPEDETPEVLSNDILGVGQQNPVFKKGPSSKHVRQHNEGDDRDEMLSLFFEGTRPINEAEAEHEEGIPLPIDEKPVAEMAKKWRHLITEADKAAETRRPMKSNNIEAEEARLKMLRESLDRKA